MDGKIDRKVEIKERERERERKREIDRRGQIYLHLINPSISNRTTARAHSMVPLTVALREKYIPSK